MAQNNSYLILSSGLDLNGSQAPEYQLDTIPQTVQQRFQAQNASSNLQISNNFCRAQKPAQTVHKVPQPHTASFESMNTSHEQNLAYGAAVPSASWPDTTLAYPPRLPGGSPTGDQAGGSYTSSVVDSAICGTHVRGLQNNAEYIKSLGSVNFPARDLHAMVTGASISARRDTSQISQTQHDYDAVVDTTQAQFWHNGEGPSIGNYSGHAEKESLRAQAQAIEPHTQEQASVWNESQLDPRIIQMSMGQASQHPVVLSGHSVQRPPVNKTNSGNHEWQPQVTTSEPENRIESRITGIPAASAAGRRFPPQGGQVAGGPRPNMAPSGDSGQRGRKHKYETCGKEKCRLLIPAG
ncbi:hypothetical protein ONS95_008954 [Cadophora gregata]|uniref:uncharacterized protein n=1 Tax=Cadophora gregata TaxID=51156 RepID=UPI0026DB1BCC|nr:uncharacterized protein ONS95_008954 [Cadophora gregata]KAK0123966.1 hypothetical protein ONS95_008954 [Cadophora gregata]KAK0130306.1 hypothetical protein ONS96_000827 [Cadophora gregata f. sp. sojae]